VKDGSLAAARFKENPEAARIQHARGAMMPSDDAERQVIQKHEIEKRVNRALDQHNLWQQVAQGEAIDGPKLLSEAAITSIVENAIATEILTRSAIEAMPEAMRRARSMRRLDLPAISRGVDRTLPRGQRAQRSSDYPH
jgi:hypothetical protein